MIQNRPDFSDRAEFKTVRVLANENLRNAELFFQHGIDCEADTDFPLVEVCRRKSIMLERILQDLSGPPSSSLHSKQLDFTNWDADFFCDYITHVHQEYLLKAVPLASSYLQQIIDNRCADEPVTRQLLSSTQSLGIELSSYFEEEQQSIFPYIIKLCRTWRRRETYGPLLVKAMKRPLEGFMNRQSFIIEATLNNMRSCLDTFREKDRDCWGHQLAIQTVRMVDADIRQLFGLETRFLFPKAVELEGLLADSK